MAFPAEYRNRRRKTLFNCMEGVSSSKERKKRG
jgi:hypothetical protein